MVDVISQLNPCSRPRNHNRPSSLAYVNGGSSKRRPAEEKGESNNSTALHDLSEKVLNTIIITIPELFTTGSESEDSCLSPTSSVSGSGASPLRLPTRPNYPTDGYTYTPYSPETYMMTPKSRISPYTRTLDYPSYHHARMKEFYQGTNSCGYNF